MSVENSIKTVGPLMHLYKGATFTHQERDYVIITMLDVNVMLCRELASGARVTIKVGDVKPPTSADIIKAMGSECVAHDSAEVTQQQWDEASRRLSFVRPLLEAGRKKSDYDEAARLAGTSRPTLYRWLTSYRETELLTSLLPAKRPGGRGVGRLPDDVEAILGAVIREFHLTMQKPSKVATAKEVQRRCRNAGVHVPHVLTVRKRIDWISGQELLAKREGSYAAQMKFDPNVSKIPEADWPLAMVEMDHTLLPIIVVNESTRQPFGRPWITLAIDVNSRVVTGMYMSMDSPSAMAAGMCIAHSILPKEKWLEERAVNIDWPVWGAMDNVHMDNAKEFHGYLIQSIALDYNINVHKRPVKKPHYGAHIERLMGTMSQKLKEVGGATFSGPAEKLQYDAEGNAILTPQEAERWMILSIAEYHHEVHSMLGTTPLQKWREGLLGTNETLPRGIPPRRLDEEKVRIDFMPFFERTVQAYGVVLDDVYYYHDVLRRWINAPDEKNQKQTKKFRFRRDPRDISRLYFFDPDAKQYCVVPYRDASRPPVSIWQLREARRIAKKQKRSDRDENTLFEIMNQKRALVDESAAKTKSAQRTQQREKEHEKARKETAKQLPKTHQVAPSGPPLVYPGYDPSKVKPLPDD
jgi:putative transposase